MVFAKPSGGLEKAAVALASAGAVAHLVFLSLFVWRTVMRGGFARYAHVVFALLSALGLASSFLGGVLVKYGGRTKARALGVWCVAFATALAGVLLVVASWTD